MFITFEGGEGTGKSTQAKLLKEYLENKNKEVVLTREPGGSAGAEEMRNLLVTGSANKWSTNTEVLLMYAARSDHFEKLIKPSLQANKWVVCDRFADSTLAYQGYGKGFDLSFLNILYQKIIGETKPDITFIFDIDVESGLQRANVRMHNANSNENRFESMDLKFHQLVRNGFLHIAAQEPARCKVINAGLPIDVVHKQVIQHLANFF
jgi:dTMP kinase